jgi:hypothetical protein
MMIPKNHRLPLLVLVIGACLLGPGSDRAHAQYGMGYGFMGGFNYVPSPTDFINSHALIQAGRGQQPRASFQPYANNPNSFHNRLRDNGFVPSYDVRRRQPTASRSQPPRSLADTARIQSQSAAAAAPAPRPVAPLASFFDVSLRLVWPSESPVEGELKEKRDTSDESSLATLQETRARQVASISTVTEARERLLNYGRPALQQIRLVATTAIADAFHTFMLSLYNSLADAAIPPAGPAPPP